MTQPSPDWILALAGILSVLIAVAALLVAIWAQRQTQAAQRSLQRPVLIIDEQKTRLHYNDDRSINWNMTITGVNPQQNVYLLQLINVGAGIATRIEGVLFGPPDPDFFAADRRLTLLGEHNLPAGEAWLYEARRDRNLVFGATVVRPRFRWFKKVYTLQAPPEPTPAQRDRLAAPRIVARLTLTYHDVYNRIHASVIDHTDNGIWRVVAFLEDIPDDLHALDQKDRPKRIPAPQSSRS